MKLGDSMAPIEACSVWNEVCPRKTRPPKIGDIPRHVAVDEESPGSSTTRSLVQIAEIRNIPESMLERSASRCRSEHGKQAASVVPPVLETFINPTETPRNLEKISRYPDERELARNDTIRANASFPRDESSDGPMLDGIRKISIGDERKNPSVRVFESAGQADCEIDEEADDTAADGSFELGLLREIQRNVEQVGATKISGTRTRRESSGYFSNLGTFDEQDPPGPITTRETHRERRGSSAKNEPNEETNLRSSENVANKAGRIEMPNIDEQPSLEINETLHLGDRNAETRILKLTELSLQSDTLEKSSSDIEKIHENRVSRDIEETNDPSSQWWPSSPRGTNRHRRRTVVHQYSSPNMTNTELERIVEKPYGERVREPERLEKEEQLGDDDDDDDDDDEVVVARTRAECDDQLLPRSIKVYQLLSTQSEDRGDGDARLYDRRISLQIARNNEEEAMRVNDCTRLPRNFEPSCSKHTEEKKLVHADSVPIIRIPSSVDSTVQGDELRLCGGERIAGSEALTGPAIGGIRPIYPYCPYSPYASPQGSPRTNRRRPLRESRRVSIDSRQGALQLNQYKLFNNIGQGSYGIVKLAYNEEDDTHYAMKILSKKKLMKKAGIFGRIAPGRKGAASNPLAKVYREIALLKKLDHPNVVKLVEVLDDPDEDNLYLVFELVQKGEVLQLPTDKPLDEEIARRHFRDVVMGVEYLHYQRIVHRDIKPSNLLVDSDGRVKVADLGVSAELRASGELLSGCTGTPAFAAPETTTPGAQYSGTLCDVWSMGVTLYSLVTGKVPWDGAGSIIGVQAAVRSEPLRFPEEPRLSDRLRDLISRMLAKDPTKRINLGEIKQHGWLTNDGQEPLPNEADNCRLPVTVTDEEVARVVTRVPKLDTLILIKTMLKQHSFQNPFLPRRNPKTACIENTESNKIGACIEQRVNDASAKLLTTGDDVAKSKTEQFHKAGRSNSAPDSFEWRTNGRQISSDSLLPPVTESSSQEAEVESR